MATARFLLKRLLASLLVLFGVSIIAFSLIRIAPGNPAMLMLPENATEEQIKNTEAKMGLDKPVVEQYLSYMGNVLQGDLGVSIFYNETCSNLIFKRLPATAQLTLIAVCISLIISIPLGIIAGIKRGTGVDFGAVLFALIGQSMSQVWFGLLLILLFGVTLGWLPTQGYGGFKNILMPAITLGLPLSAIVVRMLRSDMYDVMQEDYIVSTYAKGIGQWEIYLKYALKNALLPVITVTGMQIGQLLAGAIIVEQIFGWPGLGTLTVQAINMRDFPLIQSILLITAAIFVTVNTLVDILYTVIDPRMKLN
ncbi:ABC transporter permease [Candidatus Galacturonibacter soehngenii]|uniref:ABC transporter permease n=1 Tax=Candidatus Galacturonatibacter soehngenii TaxID=2307010 RepID=A0A7V7QI59_9FIRM|nr:ABC transporter permease [Candidatus Galacturonibacter soehngenii]KAB1435714.1 ABC transporter permease [Candidatus Galacturonibacter soehngenii]